MVRKTLSPCLPIKDQIFSTPHLAASPIATLCIILVQESFLVWLSAACFDLANSEICKFNKLTRFASPYFHFIHKFSVALLA